MSALLAVMLAAAEIQGYVSDERAVGKTRPGKEAHNCAKRCVDAGWPSSRLTVRVKQFRQSPVPAQP